MAGLRPKVSHALELPQAHNSGGSEHKHQQHESACTATSHSTLPHSQQQPGCHKPMEPPAPIGQRQGSNAEHPGGGQSQKMAGGGLALSMPQELVEPCVSLCLTKSIFYITV